MGNTMRNLVWAKTAFLMLFAVLVAAPASAQTTPQRIRGNIVSFIGDTLTIATREGPQVSLTLPAGFAPTALKRLALSDIKPNDFIATVAAPDKDGVLQAVYVAIFPEAQRGTGEGHYDWDLAPGTSMTNATVQSALTSRNGRVLSLVYKGTPIEITVPETVPVIQNTPASRDDLKPGAKVFAVADKAADGSLTLRRVTVGKDGVNPPQ
jgi:hypothetical protein